MLTIREVITRISQSRGKIFTVKFHKRSTGEERRMRCRIGVKKRLVKNPSRPPVDQQANQLITVYDMQAKNYRSIPIEGIVEFDGEEVVALDWVILREWTVGGIPYERKIRNPKTRVIEVKQAFKKLNVQHLKLYHVKDGPEQAFEIIRGTGYTIQAPKCHGAYRLGPLSRAEFDDECNKIFKHFARHIHDYI